MFSEIKLLVFLFNIMILFFLICLDVRVFVSGIFFLDIVLYSVLDILLIVFVINFLFIVLMRDIVDLDVKFFILVEKLLIYF